MVLSHAVHSFYGYVTGAPAPFSDQEKLANSTNWYTVPVVDNRGVQMCTKVLTHGCAHTQAHTMCTLAILL